MNLWNQKHTPDFDQYVWTDPALKTRAENWIKNPDQMQHMIFAGHPGTGKTTLARLLCKGMGLEENLDYVLLRVGMNTMAELIEKIVSFCEGGFSPMKVIILDEADKLTSSAQDTMRPVTDKYQHDCRFILTCNDAGRLKNFLGSRSVLIEFKALEEEKFFERMLEVAIAEEIDLDDEPTMEVLQQILKRAYPDLRQAINLMQHAHVGGKLIDPGKAVVEKEWHTYMLGCLDNLNITELRDSLQGLRRDEIATAYRVLDSNSDVFDKNEGEAVIAIAEAMDRHSRAEYPDITLLALMIKLNKLWMKK